MGKEIKEIMVEGIGYIYAEKQIDHWQDTNQPGGTYRIEKNPIKEVLKNGEMASVIWYQQGDAEYNGKYVIKVVYY